MLACLVSTSSAPREGVGARNYFYERRSVTSPRRFSAQRYRRPLFSEASSLLERMGDLEDSEIVAISTHDLDADREPLWCESGGYGHGRMEGHGDAVG